VRGLGSILLLLVFGFVMIFGSALAGDDHKCTSEAAKKKCAPGCFMSKLVKADEKNETKTCDHAKMADCTGKCTCSHT